MKIGVFDSGIGGITVLAELRARFPGVQYVYLGDTAHVPYGTKSRSQIRSLSADCARVLKSRKIDALVVACNTVSSHALDVIHEVMDPIPVFDVVQPGVEAALAAVQVLSAGKAPGSIPVLVVATRATTRSGAYGKALRARIDDVVEQECPLLVPMIEEGWVDHPILHATIAEYVDHFAKSWRPGVALLGCTHYPWVHAAFRKALPGWTIVNSAQAVADALGRSELAKSFPTGVETPPAVEWIFTDPDAVPAFAMGLLA